MKVYRGTQEGLYFSAHWCPPCRGFTPKLADFYKSMKENGEFEVIFISSDRTQEDFDGYFNDMPWVALPFSESDATTRLKEKYHISGIPTLILLDAENKVISEDGRREIMNGGNLIMERCGANKQ